MKKLKQEMGTPNTNVPVGSRIELRNRDDASYRYSWRVGKVTEHHDFTKNTSIEFEDRPGFSQKCQLAMAAIRAEYQPYQVLLPDGTDEDCMHITLQGQTVRPGLMKPLIMIPPGKNLLYGLVIDYDEESGLHIVLHEDDEDDEHGGELAYHYYDLDGTSKGHYLDKSCNKWYTRPTAVPLDSALKGRLKRGSDLFRARKRAGITKEIKQNTRYNVRNTENNTETTANYKVEIIHICAKPDDMNMDLVPTSTYRWYNLATATATQTASQDEMKVYIYDDDDDDDKAPIQLDSQKGPYGHTNHQNLVCNQAVKWMIHYKNHANSAIFWVSSLDEDAKCHYGDMLARYDGGKLLKTLVSPPAPQAPKLVEDTPVVTEQPLSSTSSGAQGIDDRMRVRIQHHYDSLSLTNPTAPKDKILKEAVKLAETETETETMIKNTHVGCKVCGRNACVGCRKECQQREASPLTIEINRSKIEDDTRFYKIVAKKDGLELIVWKRYSELRSQYEDFRKELAVTSIFPGRGLLLDVKKRTTELDTFFKDVARNINSSNKNLLFLKNVCRNNNNNWLLNKVFDVD